MAFDQKLSWVVRKNLGERVLMQLMFVILVEQSENQAKDFGILDWSVSLWLTVIEMKMIRQMLEVKEGLTWVRTMEVVIWSIMNVASMIDDDNCDDCGDNTPCNVSIISFKDLMFPFPIRWRWSFWYSSIFKGLSGKVQYGSWRMKVILLDFLQ